MQVVNWMVDSLIKLAPMGAALVGVIVVILVVRFILDKRYEGKPDQRFRLQLTLLVLSFIGLLIIIVVSPLSDTQQGQILSLIGILLSAAIALSSTTFVGNAMAGLMLRAVRSFGLGDFIRIGEHFGRVSERGLFHTEIQTEDRDLTTLPNLYLVNNPVKVIRSSGTLITADVSLGYDISRLKVEKLLLEAATAADLQEPFVHVMELGDFAITYRIAGLLPEVKHVLSARSHLREMMLDKLHEGGVEIVSPTFMNTRPLQTDQVFIPKTPSPHEKPPEDAAKTTAEDLVFDKAEEAESLEKLRERYDSLGKDLDEIKEAQKKTEDGGEHKALDEKFTRIEARRERLAEYIAQRTAEEKD